MFIDESGVKLTTIMREQIGSEVPHLRRYARALVFCPSAADDLVQSSLERALARESQWDPTQGLRSWLFRILHNLHVSSIRGQQREARLNRMEVRTDSLIANHESSSELDQVGNAMEQLPAEQREVLLLVAVEGFSYDEAASILDVPLGTVQSRLSRARQGLRERVEAPGISPMTASGETS